MKNSAVFEPLYRGTKLFRLSRIDLALALVSTRRKVIDQTGSAAHPPHGISIPKAFDLPLSMIRYDMQAADGGERRTSPFPSISSGAGRQHSALE